MRYLVLAPADIFIVLVYANLTFRNNRINSLQKQ